MTNAQKKQPKHVMMMAAGTGGHVFPALAVAKELQQQGVEVSWLATPSGTENRLLKNQKKTTARIYYLWRHFWLLLRVKKENTLKSNVTPMDVITISVDIAAAELISPASSIFKTATEASDV